MLFWGLFCCLFPGHHCKKVFLKAVEAASMLLLAWMVCSVLIVHIHRAELKVTAFIAVLDLSIRQFFLFNLAPIPVRNMASCAIAAVLNHWFT